MINMNSGYFRYSMSNRAAEAYENGEKPLSKWTKKAIIEQIEEYIKDSSISCPIEDLKKVPALVLKNLVLKRSSWHHTSYYANATDFYSVDQDKLSDLTKEDIEAALAAAKQSVVQINSYRGSINYLVWSGSRKHPKAKRCTLENVNIEEKGAFYIVTDDSGKEILRKKIGSNGTHVYRKDG